MKNCHTERSRSVTIHKESCLVSARHDIDVTFLRLVLVIFCEIIYDNAGNRGWFPVCFFTIRSVLMDTPYCHTNKRRNSRHPLVLISFCTIHNHKNGHRSQSALILPLCIRSEGKRAQIRVAFSRCLFCNHLK